MLSILLFRGRLWFKIPQYIAPYLFQALCIFVVMLQPYLHESRHLHAKRREGGCGGRFINKKKPDTTAASTVPDTHTSSYETVLRNVNNSSSSGSRPFNFSESPIRQGVMGRQQSPCIKRTQIRRIPAADATCSFPGIIFLNFIGFQKRWREKGIATWTNYGEWGKGSVSSIANCMKAHLAERCGGFFHTLERWKVLLTW